MAKTLADIHEEARRKQIEAAHAHMRARIGKRAIWTRSVSTSGWHLDYISVTVTDVKFGKIAWLIVRDDAGKEYRVKPHNVAMMGEPADYCATAYGDCRLCDGRAGQCTCTCHATE